MDMNMDIKKENKRVDVRKLTVTAMLSALSIVLYMISFRLPFMPSFLSLDFSELPALIATFSMGPVAGVTVCLVKNLVHLFMSRSMWVGEMSNLILGSSFVLTAGIIYRKKHNKKGAVIAGCTGAVVMGLVSVVSNYFIIYPLYNAMVMPYEAIMGLYKVILPSVSNLFQALVIFNMPFTFFKGMVCVIVTVLIYKPLRPLLKGER